MNPQQTSWPSHESNEILSRKRTQVIIMHQNTHQSKPAHESSFTKEEPQDNDEAFTSMCSQFHVEDNPADPSVNGDPFATEKIEPLRMKQIPGYPPSSDPLPPGIGNSEIIRSYPNHLHGRILLRMLKDWAPKDIAETCPAKEINRRMISKRIEYAKKRFDPSYKSRTRVVKQSKARNEAKGSAKVQSKGKDSARAKALEKTLDAAPSVASSSAQRDPYLMGESPLFTIPTTSLSPSPPPPSPPHPPQSFHLSYPNLGSPEDGYSFNGYNDTYPHPTYSEFPAMPYFHERQDQTSYDPSALHPWYQNRPGEALQQWEYPAQGRESTTHAHGIMNGVIDGEQEAEDQAVSNFGPWV